MNLLGRSLCVAAFLTLILTIPIAGASEAPSGTVVVSDGETHRLIRNGEPYFIKGVGGHSRLDELTDVGGNSIRTWGTDKIGEILDEAHRHGLTVTVGLWMGHERHGFDYGDESAIIRQLDGFRETVRRYKDHPAVLMWGIGNEVEGDGNNPVTWYAVNQVAREVKKIDPDHPTMTVIAELGANKIRSIERFCPDVDIIGVNSYGGITTVGDRYRAAGGSKPYIITELGPLGPWEAGRTSWGSPIEMTSTEKGKWYANGYRAAVATQKARCLGSYAFYWGHKQETTATWFGMLLPDGSRLAAVDALVEAWTGTPPANLCPRIHSLQADQTFSLKPGQIVTAKISADDPEKDKLTFRWVLRSDSGTIGAGGDPQEDESSFADAVSAKDRTAKITMPRQGGGYRLFAYVSDEKGGAAVANVPLYIDP